MSEKPARRGGAGEIARVRAAGQRGANVVAANAGELGSKQINRT